MISHPSIIAEIRRLSEEEGLDAETLAERFGTTTGALLMALRHDEQKRRKEMNLQNYRLNPAIKDRVLKMTAEGLAPEIITQRTGLSAEAQRRIRKESENKTKWRKAK